MPGNDLRVVHSESHLIYIYKNKKKVEISIVIIPI